MWFRGYDEDIRVHIIHRLVVNPCCKPELGVDPISLQKMGPQEENLFASMNVVPELRALDRRRKEE